MKLGRLSLNKASEPALVSTNDVPKPVKKPFNFQEFVSSFNSLDPQNMGSWPMPVKITLLLFTAFLVLALAYFLLLKPMLDSIDRAHAQEEVLLKDYEEKDSKLRNLQKYQEQINQMEQTFGQLLQQLPKEHEIPSLIQDINFTGVGSGLKFQDIKVESEVTREFFIELPITIVGQGDYHAFGGFISGLAALPRIITVHDFDIAPQAKTGVNAKSEVPVLAMTLHAKTYRYNDKLAEDKKAADQATKDKDAKNKDAKK